MKKAGRALAAWRVVREARRQGGPGLLPRARAIPRMVRAGLRGDYPHLSRAKVGMLGLGVAYILSPIDVVPDFLAVIGAVDDFGVLMWLTASLLAESGRYLDWERRRLPGHPEPAGPAGAEFGPEHGTARRRARAGR
jgi:Uncharacterized conserved protein